MSSELLHAPTVEADDADEDAMDDPESTRLMWLVRFRGLSASSSLSCCVTRSQSSACLWPIVACSSAKKYASAMLICAMSCSLIVVSSALFMYVGLS